MLKPLEVKTLPNYRLWLRYSDGVEGEINLSRFVGKGVFSLWNDTSLFEQVYIGEHGQIAWSDDIDLCSDALYFELTGKSAEEVFSSEKAA